MADRFFYAGPLSAGLVRLTGEEMHHMVHVCRLRPGDRVVLFNGDGREYRAVLRQISRHEVQLDIEEVAEVSRELAVAIHLAAPLPKADRAQFLVEKLTEIGVMRYIPLVTQRSIIHPGARRLDKLRRYVIEACKQCGRNRLMEIAALQNFEELLASANTTIRKLLADLSGEPLGLKLSSIDDSVLVAVGPEGGFTSEEIAQAQQAGWQIVSLGPTVLRIETAAIVLASCLALCR